MSVLNEWRGDAAPVAQYSRYTVGGTNHAGDVLTLSLNGKRVTYTANGAESLAQLALSLVTAWVNFPTFPEYREITPVSTTGQVYVDLTAATPGIPFDVTASVTGAGATLTLTRTTVTASSGPNHADEPLNWTGGAVPAAGDAAIVARGSDLLYGLGSFTADSFDFRASFTGNVGLPILNPNGYREYRTRKMTLNAPLVSIGTGPGDGSSRLFLVGVAAAAWRVEKTGFRENPDTPSLDIGATGTVASVLVSGGSDVGLLFQDESTARTFTAVGLTGDDTVLTVGRAATVGALDQDRGTCDVYGIVTAPTVGRGTYTQHEGGLTTLNAFGGLVRLNHAGTVATVTAKGRGGSEGGPQIDCEANNRLRTFTNSSFTGGACLWDENKSVTLDAGGTHAADSTFFALSRLGPEVTWNRV